MRGLREKWVDPSTRIVFQDSDSESEQIQFGPVRSYQDHVVADRATVLSRPVRVCKEGLRTPGTCLAGLVTCVILL